MLWLMGVDGVLQNKVIMVGWMSTVLDWTCVGRIESVGVRCAYVCPIKKGMCAGIGE